MRSDVVRWTLLIVGLCVLSYIEAVILRWLNFHYTEYTLTLILIGSNLILGWILYRRFISP